MEIKYETHSDGEITFIMEVIYDENDEIRRMECIDGMLVKKMMNLQNIINTRET